MKKVWKNILYHIFVMAVIAGVLITASILAYRSTYPKELTRSEDGYYEIYTACDYERFWQMVSHDQTFVKGRLMNDIYLNDLSGYEEWENTPPVRQSKDILLFTGAFDGNGHTIFGLYSQNGYGLVKKNAGTIHDLIIKDSLIMGSDKAGGICQINVKVISNCEFGGKIKSNLEKPCTWARMAGICVNNSGTINRCGYRGSMEVSCDWSGKGIMAGICTDNEEEIVNCYNLTPDNSDKGEEIFYAISDAGEEGCFIGENLKENTCYDAHDMPLSKTQAAYLQAFLDRDLFAVYQGEKGRQIFLQKPVGVKESLEMKSLEIRSLKLEELLDSLDLTREKEASQLPADEMTETIDRWSRCSLAHVDDEKGLIRAFSNEKVSDLIWEVFTYKGKDWNEVELKAVESPENVLFAVDLSDGSERIRLAAYLPDKEVEEPDEIWAYCSDILGEQDTESWEHATWKVTTSSRIENAEDIFILYQMSDKRNGFFHMEGGILYQIESEAAAGEDTFLRLRNRIRLLEEADEEMGDVPGNDQLWEHLFWEVCRDKFFTDALAWKDENVKRAVYNEIREYEAENPSTEEMIDLEYLQINNADQVSTFQDLSMFPNLTTLSLKGGEDAIKFDLTQKMVPALRALYIMWGNLTDISFLREFPDLEDISFYGNEIEDISPLAYCKELKVLSLGYNHVEDITPLAGLSKLEEAGLQGNEIKDIEALRFLPDLKGVNLHGNEISDLSPLAGKTQLEALGASFNQISDISPLKGMDQMYNLALDMNQITDISALENMTQMEYLGLAGNQIEDYEPLKGMEKLFYLSVIGNPGQDIGGLIFVPVLNLGRNGMITDEEQKIAQDYLDTCYPGQGIEAEDIAWGDLDGDGRDDIVVTGLTGQTEDDYYSGTRMIYPFLRQSDGSLIPLDEIETRSPNEGGVYGDPYQGMIITDKKLVIKIYGGSNWRWGYTKIYEYENGHMEEKWELDLDHFVMTEGYDWTVYDEEKNLRRFYVIAGDVEREKDILLIDVSENIDEEGHSLAWKELNEKVEEIGESMGKTLPDVDYDDLVPEIGSGYYEYQVYETLLPIERKPEQVLKWAAEKYLSESVALPVFIYSSDEIRNSYIRLTGLEVPKEFCLGFEQGEPKLLVYIGCEQNEEGAWIHKLRMEGVSEKYWTGEKVIWFNENTGTFTTA